MFSDHAPLLYSLKINFSKSTDIENSNNAQPENYTYYKWSEEYKHCFRRDIISQLQGFNNLFNTTDHSDSNSIDRLVDGFSSLIVDCAEPYFKKELKIDKSSPSPHKHDSPWFDSECRLAKYEYLGALSSFNRLKNNENRSILCRKKKIYKRLVKCKKNEYRVQKSSDLADLRKKNPREFWNHFKCKKGNRSCCIGTNDLKTYFSSLLNNIRSVQLPEVEHFVNEQNFNKNDSTFDCLNNPISAEETRSKQFTDIIFAVYERFRTLSTRQTRLWANYERSLFNNFTIR
ncbi:hypothetical protein ACF0H5_000407 [Mactra antiquata]